MGINRKAFIKSAFGMAGGVVLPPVAARAAEGPAFQMGESLGRHLAMKLQ